MSKQSNTQTDYAASIAWQSAGNKAPKAKAKGSGTGSIWIPRTLTIIILIAVFYYAKQDVQTFMRGWS